MTEIVLVRQSKAEIPHADREAAKRVLFGLIDGLSPAHRKSWRRLWNWLLTKAEPGEFVELRTHRERIGWFHRKHMALEQSVFEHQDKFETFESFRTWLKVGAGFVDWYPGPKGGVIPVPRSISYAKLEEEDMGKFHDEAVAFLRTEHAGKTLWKHLTPAARIEMIETILAGFDE